MRPTVRQYLESIQKTVNEQIVPVVGGNPFLAEQAHLIAASLAMLIEVQPYEDDYLRVELADLRRCMDILQACEPEVPLVDRDQLLSEVHRLKQRQHELLQAQAAAHGGTLPASIRDAIGPWLERQTARELSWTRRTGFHPQASALPAIHDVLATQRSGS